MCKVLFVIVLDDSTGRRFISDVDVRVVWWKPAHKYIWIWFPVVCHDLAQALRWPEETAVERRQFLMYGQPSDLIAVQPWMLRRVLEDASGEFVR